MGTLRFDSKVPGRSYKALKLVGGTMVAAGVHQSEVVDVRDYAILRGIVKSDQNGATNGFILQEGVIDSTDTFKALKSTTATVTANTASSVEVALLGEYLRVDFTNGGTVANDVNMWLLLIPRDLAGV